MILSRKRVLRTGTAAWGYLSKMIAVPKPNGIPLEAIALSSIDSLSIAILMPIAAKSRCAMS